MKNKTILITGSSNGIGAGIALHFGKLGYDVAVTYRSDKKSGEKIVSEIIESGSNAKLYKLDVMDEKNVTEVFSLIKRDFNGLDVLVNNAAVDWGMTFESCTFEDWKEITRTKIDGNFLCAKYALPLLKKSDNPNIIVIMSSMYSNIDPDDPAYCVGTAGTVTFMKCAAKALAKYKIRTNGIGAGETNTNLKYWKDNTSETLWKELAEKNPLGRVGTPEDVAKVVQMVVEDKTNFLNGNTIYINGGSHL